MSGITIDVRMDDREVKAMLATLQQRLGNLRPVMATIGEIVRSSVVENFMKGGRPRWKVSRRAAREGGLTLSDTAILRKSITSKAIGNKAVVGTNVIYAAIHQFGGVISIAARMAEFRQVRRTKKQAEIFGKGKSWRFAKEGKGTHLQQFKERIIKIPARPFLMVHDEDWHTIRYELNDYLMKGLK